MNGVRSIVDRGIELRDRNLSQDAGESSEGENSTGESSHERDRELALALLAGDPDALREAEAGALPDTMPLSNIARLLLLAAQRGQEATRAHDSSRARIAASWEAALLCGGALAAQERVRQGRAARSNRRTGSA